MLAFEHFINPEKPPFTRQKRDLLARSLAYRSRVTGVVVTILRHPVERVLSRYWYEGRWDLFEKKDTVKPPTEFADWIAAHGAGSRGHRAERLWQVPSEYYTKSFAGWRGAAMCDARGDATCDAESGLGGAQLAAAFAVLASELDLILVTEWLSHPRSIALAATKLCFELAPDGETPRRQDAARQTRSVPDFRKLQPFGGGHSAKRPPRWTPGDAQLKHLWNSNKLDLRLYEQAALDLRQRAPRVDAAPPHPSLPPTDTWQNYRDFLLTQ